MPPLRVILNLRRQFYSIFSCSQARKKKLKKCLLRHRLPLRLRHLIFQFGRKIKTYVPKNKIKIKVIPHQYKMTLKTMTICLHRTVLTRKNTLFFAFCIVEEVYLVVTWGYCYFRIYYFLFVICYD